MSHNKETGKFRIILHNTKLQQQLKNIGFQGGQCRTNTGHILKDFRAKKAIFT